MQGLLELADVPYVGCGVLGSALAMDKAMAKEVLAAARHPPGPAGSAVHATHERRARPPPARSSADELGLPVFVKPANMGSSVGVTKATTVAELARRHRRSR